MSIYGWYSLIQDIRYGHAVYADKNGLLIKVTEVVKEKDQRPLAKWNDYVYVGELDKFVTPNISALARMNEPVTQESLELLLNTAMDRKKEQEACKAQLPKTNRCFCYLCPSRSN